MFSVLSRLTRPAETRRRDGADSAPAPMSSSLQRKFARGVDYNMKILIKGDRNVGKSCLLRRLQGGEFVEEYVPTDEIRVAPVHWKYRDTEHVIKVEVWEVVDRGRARRRTTAGLKLDNSAASPAAEAIETPALDATFLDVYANADGVIMMMDITKAWTFEYVKREIETVPPDLPVIVLGNHCDMHHHREVDAYPIEAFLTGVARKRSGPVRYAESSMRNGFGLRLLHKFFNVPFLRLQRRTLLERLAANDRDLKDAFDELDEFERSEGADYESFLSRIASERKRSAAPESAGRPAIASDRSPSIVLGAGRPIVPLDANPLARAALVRNRKRSDPSLEPDAPARSAPPDSKSVPAAPGRTSAGSKEDLDDFCAGVLDNNFLDDHSSVAASGADGGRRIADSDSDVDAGANPLVAGIQDDLDSTDEDENVNEPNVKLNVSSIPSLRYENANENRSGNEFSHFDPTERNYANSDNKFDMSSLYNNVTAMRTHDRESVDDDRYDGSDFRQPPGYDSAASWSLDTSARRSPEGGEGASPVNESKKDKKVREEKRKKSKKSKDSEKSSKKDKDNKEKSKEKKHKEKKHKKKGSDEYLEEFLSGGASKTDTTYEVI